MGVYTVYIHRLLYYWEHFEIKLLQTSRRRSNSWTDDDIHMDVSMLSVMGYHLRYFFPWNTGPEGFVKVVYLENVPVYSISLITWYVLLTLGSCLTTKTSLIQIMPYACRKEIEKVIDSLCARYTYTVGERAIATLTRKQNTTTHTG